MFRYSMVPSVLLLVSCQAAQDITQSPTPIVTQPGAGASDGGTRTPPTRPNGPITIISAEEVGEGQRYTPSRLSEPGSRKIEVTLFLKNENSSVDYPAASGWSFAMNGVNRLAEPSGPCVGAILSLGGYVQCTLSIEAEPDFKPNKIRYSGTTPALEAPISPTPCLFCDGKCIDLKTNKEHCGSCGNKAVYRNINSWSEETHSFCDNGTVKCLKSGYELCLSGRADAGTGVGEAERYDLQTGTPSSSSRSYGLTVYCGSCENEFKSGNGLQCTAGVLACSNRSESRCGDYCVDLSQNRWNCGSCGNEVTAPNASCVNGVPKCNSKGYSICNNTCIDTRLDENNCGRCGNTCSTVVPVRSPPQGISLMSSSDCQLYTGGISECIVTYSVNTYTQTPLSCDAICTAVGLTCFRAVKYSGATQTNLPCNQAFNYTGTERCECTR